MNFGTDEFCLNKKLFLTICDPDVNPVCDDCSDRFRGLNRMEGNFKSVSKTFMIILLLHFASANKPVKLELYYESLCFACRNFISGPLQEAFKTLQDSGKATKFDF